MSPHIPTPTSTLVDYSLIKDLGLKMYDLQYQKFSYCGHKLRIIGKVSITVQTIHDGLASGSFHIRANVMLDLHKAVDCEAVAGIKLSSCLDAAERLSTDSDDSSPSTPSSRSSPKATPSAKSSPMATPSARARPSAPPPSARPSASPPPARPSASPSSPPGFPPKPSYNYPNIIKPKRPEISVSLTKIPDPNPTILTANIFALSETFHDADLQPKVNQEVHVLLQADPGGRIAPSVNNVTSFKTSGGLVYEFGHGREKCVPDKCMLRTQDRMPHNCGYHNQWYRPYNFQICGPSCSGSFCSCLNFY